MKLQVDLALVKKPIISDSLLIASIGTTTAGMYRPWGKDEDPRRKPMLRYSSKPEEVFTKVTRRLEKPLENYQTLRY